MGGGKGCEGGEGGAWHKGRGKWKVREPGEEKWEANSANAQWR